MTDTYRLWRDPQRGKHHMSDDATMALCGQPIWPFWETQGAVRWSDEDACKLCARSRRVTAGPEPSASADQHGMGAMTHNDKESHEHR